MRDLKVVVGRLEALQKKTRTLLYESTTSNSVELTNEPDTTLAKLTSMNDELLGCIKTYQQTVGRIESGGALHPEGATAYGRVLDTGIASACGQAAPSGPESVTNAVSSAVYGSASTAQSASSDSQVKGQVSARNLLVLYELQSICCVYGLLQFLLRYLSS
ncbi:unnamed protein product [Dibothriocephalus latus]|uniref:GAT domain-containing protein n=1 Tax=Dibothriocephalus latus TaxID=60516 RepID=A0A3P7PEB5_DIBLA|nr:unnamed protein product [Dibothriocephalus latus]